MLRMAGSGHLPDPLGRRCPSCAAGSERGVLVLGPESLGIGRAHGLRAWSTNGVAGRRGRTATQTLSHRPWRATVRRAVGSPGVDSVDQPSSNVADRAHIGERRGCYLEQVVVLAVRENASERLFIVLHAQVPLRRVRSRAAPVAPVAARTQPRSSDRPEVADARDSRTPWVLPAHEDDRRSRSWRRSSGGRLGKDAIADGQPT